MIELKNVSKFYSDNNIVTVGLKNVNLKLNKGEFVAITGDSGSGKSTLLNVISSIDTYDEGEILFYDCETFYFNQNDSDIFRKNNVSFVFQKYNIIDSYTVLQNVMLPLVIKGIPDAEAEEKALEIIRQVGLENRIHNKGTNLSGGEKQRCVIARALATDAPILACDEPTGNLDSKTGAEIIKLIKEVAKDKLVLIVTHDYDAIKDICTRKIKLSDGEIIEDITFQAGIEEEKRDLVLEDVKPSKKTLAKLAMRNLRSTPKKTTFSSLVFTFVSCLFLLLSLFMVQVSYDQTWSYNDVYGIVSENRMIIYEDNHQALDMEKLKPVLQDVEYYENPFYEETHFTYVFGEDSTYYNNVSAGLTFTAISHELLAGISPTNNREYTLILPVDYYWQGYADALDTDIYMFVETHSMSYRLPIGKLVGVGVSETVNRPYLMCGAFNLETANMVLNSDVDLNIASTKSDSAYVAKAYEKDAEKSYILLPSELEGDVTLEFSLKNLYAVSYDLDVRYSEYEYNPTLVMNEDFMYGKVAPNFGGVKEISVYTDDVQGLAKEVERLGYDVSIPSMEESQDILSMIVLYMLIGVIVLALVIMFYVSFAIIQRVYLTKTKDYSIFRTLGLVSKDLKQVLILEVLITTAIAIVAGAIFTNVIIIAAKLTLYKYVSLTLLALYTLTMLVFGLLTANRLNNKIFKNSVYQSIKDGGEQA